MDTGRVVGGWEDAQRVVVEGKGGRVDIVYISYPIHTYAHIYIYIYIYTYACIYIYTYISIAILAQGLCSITQAI